MCGISCPFKVLPDGKNQFRTGLPFQESPVFRSAYSETTIHRIVFSETLDLQASPFIIRTVLPFQESLVFRSAYSETTIHRIVISETLDLQASPFIIPLRVPSKWGGDAARGIFVVKGGFLWGECGAPWGDGCGDDGA